MDSLKQLQTYANSIVELTFDEYMKTKNKMYFRMLYLGIGNYKVEVHPNAGHNYHMILNGIYNYAKKNVDKDMKTIFEDSLLEVIDGTYYPADFNLLTNYFVTEFDNEINNVSPFRIDINKIANGLKNRIEVCDMLKDNKGVKYDLQNTFDYINSKLNK